MDDFSILNSAGRDVVRYHGQAFGWRDRKGALFSCSMSWLDYLTNVGCGMIESGDARQMPLLTVRNKVLVFQRHS